MHALKEMKTVKIHNKQSLQTVLQSQKCKEVIYYLCNQKRPMILPYVLWVAKWNKWRINLKQKSLVHKLLDTIYN